MSRLKDLMDLSHVPRWTTHPVSRPQSVAEHTFRVMVITMELWELLDEERGEVHGLPVLLWAMIHDAPESKTGDMPRPFKNMVGREAVLALEIAACPWFFAPKEGSFVSNIVSMADAVEALSWISTYGNVLRDKFTQEGLESQLRRRVYTQAQTLGEKWVEAVNKILAEIAP